MKNNSFKMMNKQQEYIINEIWLKNKAYNYRSSKGIIHISFGFSIHSAYGTLLLREALRSINEEA